VLLVSAGNRSGRRTVSIRVKARRSGDWQTSNDEGRPCQPNPTGTDFWIFAGFLTTPPQCYVAPDWLVRNDIRQCHQAFLARHGGERARTGDSTHHGIQLDRIARWRDRWDLLGIF